MEIVMTLCDFHVPFHDPKAISVALNFAKHLKPSHLVIHEVIDFYTISRFDKNPMRKFDLQFELDKSYSVLSMIKDAVPKTKIIMVESNHDIRLRKYLSSQARELSSLSCLELTKLLRLDQLGIDYRMDFIYKNILFKHGNIIRKESGYTARAELDKEGMSGASGHSHRLGSHYKTVRGGKYVWLESGCLCKTKDVEYIEGTANWQQGLSMFIFKDKSNHFDPKVVSLIDYQIMWGSKVIG